MTTQSQVQTMLQGALGNQTTAQSAVPSGVNNGNPNSVYNWSSYIPNILRDAQGTPTGANFNLLTSQPQASSPPTAWNTGYSTPFTADPFAAMLLSQLSQYRGPSASQLPGYGQGNNMINTILNNMINRPQTTPPPTTGGGGTAPPGTTVPPGTTTPPGTGTQPVVTNPAMGGGSSGSGTTPVNYTNVYGTPVISPSAGIGTYQPVFGNNGTGSFGSSGGSAPSTGTSTGPNPWGNAPNPTYEGGVSGGGIGNAILEGLAPSTSASGEQLSGWDRFLNTITTGLGVPQWWDGNPDNNQFNLGDTIGNLAMEQSGINTIGDIADMFGGVFGGTTPINNEAAIFAPQDNWMSNYLDQQVSAMPTGSSFETWGSATDVANAQAAGGTAPDQAVTDAWVAQQAAAPTRNAQGRTAEEDAAYRAGLDFQSDLAASNYGADIGFVAPSAAQPRER